MRVDGRRRSDIFRLDYILYKKTAALALHLLTAISPMYEYMLITTSIPHLYVYLISKSPSTRVEFSQPPLSHVQSSHSSPLRRRRRRKKTPHPTPLYPTLPFTPPPPKYLPTHLSHPIPSHPFFQALLLISRRFSPSIHPSIHPIANIATAAAVFLPLVHTVPTKVLVRVSSLLCVSGVVSVQGVLGAGLDSWLAGWLSVGSEVDGVFEEEKRGGGGVGGVSVLGRLMDGLR